MFLIPNPINLSSSNRSNVFTECSFNGLIVVDGITMSFLLFSSNGCNIDTGSNFVLIVKILGF